MFSGVQTVIDASTCNLLPPRSFTWLLAASSDTWRALETKIHEKPVLAPQSATLSDTLDTSLGTNSCGSLQLLNAAEANSHIYNGKQGPFRKATVLEKYCY